MKPKPMAMIVCSAVLAAAAAGAEEPSGENLPNGRDYFILRDGLDRCRAQFLQRRTGRVVFVGGSITNMNGWRQLVGQDLQRRFPDTKFEFVNAGIPSTGSVPGAFRLVRDAFAAGPVDLLIEEAAVNDATNRPGNSKQWLRGMEGIVRQARALNPRVDIVMLHFVDPDKMRAYQAGKTPEVIAAHERVAERYGVVSVHLAREVTERIAAGQFTWQDDFRNLHPAPFGHRLYAGTIGRMFDAAWRDDPPPKDGRPAPHPMPEPLDADSYARGRLVGVERAKPGEGWQLDAQWRPRTAAERAGTRPGFVDVPMLVAEQPDAELMFSFTGTAVGLWIVAGPDVGVIEYRIDEGPWQRRDQFTQWSRGLHLPWTLVLADELPDGPHQLTLRTTDQRHAGSLGHACRIVSFCVNGPAN